MLVFFAVVAGIGNGVFHPVDYTLLNRKVHALSPRPRVQRARHHRQPRLGAGAGACWCRSRWRSAGASRSRAPACSCWSCWRCWSLNRSRLRIETTSAAPRATNKASAPAAADGSFGFLRIPAVWMCFGFFFLYAVVLGGVQAFAPEAARLLHDVPVRWAAMCLTFYMVASAGGMVIGGFLAADPSRCEKIVGLGFGVAAALALTIGFAPLAPMAVPALFALMGVASGMAGPSRDLIVKRAAPDDATGRVYGVVYSGLDIGQAFAPLVFGPLMDLHRPADVWLGIAIAQALLIATAFNVHRARRTALRAGDGVGRSRGTSSRPTTTDQTALRCRSMQVATTSSAGRFHQSSVEKISTSL